MKIKNLHKQIKGLKEMLADKQIKIELLEKQLEIIETQGISTKKAKQEAIEWFKQHKGKKMVD